MSTATLFNAKMWMFALAGGIVSMFYNIIMYPLKSKATLSKLGTDDVVVTSIRIADDDDSSVFNGGYEQHIDDSDSGNTTGTSGDILLDSIPTSSDLKNSTYTNIGTSTVIPSTAHHTRYRHHVHTPASQSGVPSVNVAGTIPVQDSDAAQHGHIIDNDNTPSVGFPTGHINVSNLTSNDDEDIQVLEQSGIELTGEPAARVAAKKIPTHDLSVSSIMSSVPWHLAPFVFGMFVLVQALVEEGWVEVIADACISVVGGYESINSSKQPQFVAIAVMLTATVLISNLINNQPATILFARVLLSDAFMKLPHKAQLGAAYAVITGSNNAALLTFIGSLAGKLKKTSSPSRIQKKTIFTSFFLYFHL
jgi:hypothetical protein